MRVYKSTLIFSHLTNRLYFYSFTALVIIFVWISFPNEYVSLAIVSMNVRCFFQIENLAHYCVNIFKFTLHTKHLCKHLQRLCLFYFPFVCCVFEFQTINAHCSGFNCNLQYFLWSWSGSAYSKRNSFVYLTTLIFSSYFFCTRSHIKRLQLIQAQRRMQLFIYVFNVLFRRSMVFFFSLSLRSLCLYVLIQHFVIFFFKFIFVLKRYNQFRCTSISTHEK